MTQEGIKSGMKILKLNYKQGFVNSDKKQLQCLEDPGLL
jgi:hypothetical protein